MSFVKPDEILHYMIPQAVPQTIWNTALKGALRFKNIRNVALLDTSEVTVYKSWAGLAERKREALCEPAATSAALFPSSSVKSLYFNTYSKHQAVSTHLGP